MSTAVTKSRRRANPARHLIGRRAQANMVLCYAVLRSIVVPRAWQAYADLAFLALSAIMLLTTVVYSLRGTANPALPAEETRLKAPGVVYAGLTALVMLTVMTSPYGWTYTLVAYSFAIATAWHFTRNAPTNRALASPRVESALSMIAAAVIAFQVLEALGTGEPFVLWSSWDGNFTGMVILLYLMWSIKLRNGLGVIAALSTVLVNESRLFIGLTLLLFAMRGLKHALPKGWSARRGTVAGIMGVMIVLSVPFSTYWVDVVGANGVAAYRTSINDTSNRMRFAANLAGIDRLKEDPALLLVGYDAQIKEELGVVDVDEGRASQMRGDRAVVPHHAFFNLALRSGVLFAVLYFLAVGRVVDQYFTKENFEYVVAYLMGSMIMHSLLVGSILVLWVAVLATPARDRAAFR